MYVLGLDKVFGLKKFLLIFRNCFKQGTTANQFLSSLKVCRKKT